MESVLNHLISFMDNHASAIFGAIGAIFGFLTNYFFKKFDRKNEISKEEAKEYFKQKRIVLNESLKLISKYELIIETLHDFYEDNNGVPVKMITKEEKKIVEDKMNNPLDHNPIQIFQIPLNLNGIIKNL